MKVVVCVANNKGILFNKRKVSRDEVVDRDIEENHSDAYVMTDSKAKKADEISEIILYKWNRDYPADTFFDFNHKEFDLVSSVDFPGKSHERITKEIWIRK